MYRKKCDRHVHISRKCNRQVHVSQKVRLASACMEKSVIDKCMYRSQCGQQVYSQNMFSTMCLFPDHLSSELCPEGYVCVCVCRSGEISRPRITPPGSTRKRFFASGSPFFQTFSGSLCVCPSGAISRFQITPPGSIRKRFFASGSTFFRALSGSLCVCRSKAISGFPP